MLLNHNPASTCLAIMTEYAAYFDDSGHPDDQAAVVVAGFIATEKNWLLFEREWQEILDREGMELFHMADFVNSRIWPQHKKDSILRRLVNTIQIRTIRPICHIVMMKAYKDVNDKYTLEECVGTPYALAGRTVAASINRWKNSNMEEGDRILAFFEDGTKHKGDFIDTMQRDKLPCPAFVGKKEAVPCQAADWLAWEMFQSVKTSIPKVSENLARMVKSLPDDDPDMAFYSEDDLLAMCQRFPGPVIKLRSELPKDAKFSFHSSPKKPRKRTIK